MTKEEAQKEADKMNEAAERLYCPLSAMANNCDGIKCAWFDKAYPHHGGAQLDDSWRVYGEGVCSVMSLKRLRDIQHIGV